MSLPPVLQGRLSLPAVASPLFIISNPKLIIAQCKAGIVGSFPSLNARPLEMFDQWLTEIKAALAEHDAAHPEQRVSATAALFGALDRLYLVIPPEGTRSRTAYWKSGFYWIAREAAVPVQLTALDYTTKAGTFGPLLDASASPSAFMDQVRAFYAGRQGRYPDDFGPVRLQDEGDGS